MTCERIAILKRIVNIRS